MTGPRRERVAASIRSELTRVLQTEMHDPRVGFVTVTGVEVTPDLTRAWVYVSIMGSEADRNASLQALEGARGFLRRELSHALTLRRTPALEFRLDISGERGERIERLLEEQGLGHARRASEPDPDGDGPGGEPLAGPGERDEP